MRASTRPRAEPSEPNRARKGNGNRRRGNANPSLAIRGDREIYCSWLSVRPAPARRRRCDWGFWLERAHADQPAVLVDALYDVSVQLELGYDGRLIGGARSSQNPGRARLPVAAPASIAKDRASRDRVWCVLRPLDAAKARRFTIIVRAVQSSGNGRPAAPRPWTGSSRLHAERTICGKLACSLHGRGSCRSPRNQYAHKPNDKVTASRRAAACLRSAVSAPLSTSAPDRMHARGCFPQCSRTNAPTPPMTVSPRFAKSVLVVRSRRTRWSRRC